METSLTSESTVSLLGLFRLPRELRDQIYDCTLDGTLVTVSCCDTKLDIIYDLKETVWLQEYYANSCLYSTSSHTRLKPLRWLLTSTRILAEGLDQFYRKAVLVRIQKYFPVRFQLAGQLFTLRRIRSFSPLKECIFSTFIVREQDDQLKMVRKTCHRMSTLEIEDLVYAMGAMEMVSEEHQVQTSAAWVSPLGACGQPRTEPGLGPFVP